MNYGDDQGQLRKRGSFPPTIFLLSLYISAQGLPPFPPEAAMGEIQPPVLAGQGVLAITTLTTVV